MLENNSAKNGQNFGRQIIFLEQTSIIIIFSGQLSDHYLSSVPQFWHKNQIGAIHQDSGQKGTNSVDPLSALLDSLDPKV